MLHSTSCATLTFEAARQIDALPAQHAASRVHGHHFQATVHAGQSALSPAYAGGYQEALLAPWQAAIAPLDYQPLHQLLAASDDTAIAQYLLQQGAPHAQAAVSLASTPDQGVHLHPACGQYRYWRRFQFHAAHYLPKVPLGHKCGNLHGHQFAVVLQTRHDAPVSPANAAYDDMTARWVLLHTQLDHAYLNDIAGLENPTSELLSRWIWERLSPQWPALEHVCVYETASCGACYNGDHFRIWKDFHMDSAVRFEQAPDGSARARLHGHTYTVRLHLQAALDEVLGWAVDFGDVKHQFAPLFKAMDHHHLGQLPGLTDCDSGSLARWIYQQFQPTQNALCQVDVMESSGNGARYHPHAPALADLLLPL